ncbi:D-alanyl-D-alanine carboxypeptidase [Paenibacillus darwinianus]|uniref:serine-type D-Ala-D-Ala carboxypeptidase n=1 Tax=Paenibacillus darwinianus TaxID=1380763 RepID=A0A9W5S199_9BACL|nr:D-alanyl-D-alanine carboxypeptidase family protein [Paenibacillus darwinianus]EXX88261.1 D-alanyl-D-alanine carboxypeptidase [Paenibacillus darwinianus]EXX88566.1 D-alanyl-D-alanine carboxypeptidase [Paenibacillus darwinianus]EXX91757.1 D-alanyl-D-alanine carboxypeptidase [Paenibacillus darwinianus]
MKKWKIASLLACTVLVGGANAAFALEEPAKPQGQAANVDLAPSARSAILMDADSGTIIFEKNSYDRLPPASITKIMTMLLIMEAIDQGKLKLTDAVTTSEYAASMGGSQIFLEPGEQMTVQDMLKGIALASGNDASVAMAEKIAGTEQEFVRMMNEKAQSLGLKNTRFANPNGLPAPEHYTSAHDIAIMSKELLKYREITAYTGLYQDYLRKDSEKPFWLVNTNKLVRFYSGADGLKTGFTSEAKFCLSATAARDGFRLIAVVLGEPNTKTRNAEVSQMFDYAFAQYTNVPIFKEGDVIGTVPVTKGNLAELKLTATHPYSVMMKRGANKTDIRSELRLTAPLMAPVLQGQSIGKLIVFQEDKVLAEFDVQSPQAIGKAGWWTLFRRTTAELFT